MNGDTKEHPYLSEDDFSESLSRLNALCGLTSTWQKTVAIKDHVDEVGIEIKRGESYYKRDVGSGYSNVLKLSRVAMDKLLYCTIYTCPEMEAAADILQEEQQRRFMALRGRAAT